MRLLIRSVLFWTGTPRSTNCETKIATPFVEGRSIRKIHFSGSRQEKEMIMKGKEQESKPRLSWKRITRHGPISLVALVDIQAVFRLMSLEIIQTCSSNMGGLVAPQI